MKFDLINTEGGLIKIEKLPQHELFTITDEDDKVICRMTKHALGLYLNGAIILVDSRGREWDYLNVDKNMKSDPKKLTEYIIKVLYE